MSNACDHTQKLVALKPFLFKKKPLRNYSRATVQTVRAVLLSSIGISAAMPTTGRPSLMSDPAPVESRENDENRMVRELLERLQTLEKKIGIQPHAYETIHACIHTHAYTCILYEHIHTRT